MLFVNIFLSLIPLHTSTMLPLTLTKSRLTNSFTTLRPKNWKKGYG